ncbi:MAG TPA: hypothetical protein VF738_15170 [Rhodanobacter sp.]
MRHSPFLDIAAVEAWDAWFRWRDQGGLRDLTVDDTLRRVVHALSRCEPQSCRAGWEQQLLDALAGWRLLLDERILASAGTDRPCWPRDRLAAALNPAVFVKAPFTALASFRYEAFEAVARLAVHALDNAGLLAAGEHPGTHLRIGMVGLADTLAQLGHAYDSPQGRQAARAITQSLARGCLQGSLRLARERGALLSPPDALRRLGRLGELGDAAEAADAVRHGLRHGSLTAIDSQKRLALLANNVADAADPLLAHGDIHAIPDAETNRLVCSPGYAVSLAKRLHAHQALRSVGTELAELSAQAQPALCEAIQPWIDEPICYPSPLAGSEETRKAIATHVGCNA